MFKSEEKKPKAKLTTSQILGFTLVGSSSLYRYVRDFADFFSPTARQHKKGRRWTIEDLEVVQAIRCLYHERTGSDRIREMLSGGWRVEFNPMYTKELISRLVEVVLAAYEDSREISKKAEEAINNSIEQSKSAEFNDQLFRELTISVWDIQDEQKWIEKGLALRGLVREAKKKGEWKYPSDIHLYPRVRPPRIIGGAKNERFWDWRDEITKRILGRW